MICTMAYGVTYVNSVARPYRPTSPRPIRRGNLLSIMSWIETIATAMMKITANIIVTH